MSQHDTVQGLALIALTIGLAIMVKLIVDNMNGKLLRLVRRKLRHTTYVCGEHRRYILKGLALICEVRCIYCIMIKKFEEIQKLSESTDKSKGEK